MQLVLRFWNKRFPFVGEADVSETGFNVFSYFRYVNSKEKSLLKNIIYFQASGIKKLANNRIKFHVIVFEFIRSFESHVLVSRIEWLGEANGD